MIYSPAHQDMLIAITYGSHLYGTSSPASDHDFKAVTMPSYQDLILAKPLKVSRYRFDADGQPLGDPNSTMPDNGYEAEHTPLQKFVYDFLSGQAYAVEMVFGILQGAHEKHIGPPTSRSSRRAHHFVALARALGTEFIHRNVQGMVGFAMKQTFDYVKRGERLNAARAVLAEIERLQSVVLQDVFDFSVRLDTPLVGPSSKAHTVLDEIAERAGVEIGSTENNHKTLRTLKLNSREYLESTTLVHFKNAVQKLIDQYGDRSTKAAETDVDWKSLSHAVRVYEQVIELLKTKYITFPRENAQELLEIKQGRVPLETVKALLIDLDAQVQDLLLASTLPEVDEAFRTKVDGMLFKWIMELYELES